MAELLTDLAFDDVAPHAPFSELHRRTISLPIDQVWPHCLNVTAREVRTIGPLMALRGLPRRMRGKRPPQTSAPKPLLDVFASEGFVVLRRDEAPTDGSAVVIFGAAGKFWSLAENAPQPFVDPQAFLDFDQPDFAKTICRLEAIDLGDGATRIETETIVWGTDRASEKKFRPYWMVIRLPSGLIRRSWLAAIERRSPS